MKVAADKGSGDMVNRGSHVKRITEKTVDLAGVAVAATFEPKTLLTPPLTCAAAHACRTDSRYLHQGSGGSPSGGVGREERRAVRMRDVGERLSYVFGRGKDGLRFHFSCHYKFKKINP